MSLAWPAEIQITLLRAEAAPVAVERMKRVVIRPEQVAGVAVRVAP